MLDADTKRRIDTARDILVGKVPDPKSQVEQITIALIYKFMDDIDAESEGLGGKRKFFADEFAKYGWAKLMRAGLSGYEMLNLYAEAITRMPENPGIPSLFRSIFNNAYLPYRDPETLRLFLKVIDEFRYDHSERLGDAFEYLLSVLGSQGDAGQFRTPRHIIEFMVKIVNPQKDESVLDPACGTGGFLISSYKRILADNTDENGNITLTPDERARLAGNLVGYDISPDMARLSLVNMYLHGLAQPNIYEYDTLTSEERWNEYADVILANPPFMSPKGGIRPHSRFAIKARRSEVLFVDYIAEHLRTDGRAAVIVPEGIIFQSQRAHRELRKMLVEECLVAVASLPAGVFNPYSGVKTSILILDKALARRTEHIAFFKVDNDGYDLGAQRREIAENDLPETLLAVREYMDGVSSTKDTKGREGGLPQEAQKSQKGDRMTAGWSRRLSTKDAKGREGEDGAILRSLVERGSVIIATKEDVAASGDYNLSGERYRESVRREAEFPYVSLKSVAKISAGNSAPQGEEYFKDGEFPFIRTADVGAVHRSDNFIGTKDKVNQKAIDEKGLRLFPVGSILFPKSGASIYLNHRALISEVAYVSSHLACIVCDESKALPKYVYHLLCQVDAREITANQSYPSLRLSAIDAISIPLPPLEVQREIVAEVEGYQRVIDGARAVVDNWRPRIAVEPEWPMVALGKIANEIKVGFACGKAGIETEGVPHIRPMNITNVGQFSWDGLKRIRIENYQGREDYALIPGDILFNNTNSTDLVGKTCYIYQHIKGGYSNHMTRIRVNNDRCVSKFVVYALHTAWQKGAFSDRANKWIGQAGINTKSLSAFKISLPPIEVQQAIVAEIEAERVLVDANRELVERMEGRIAAAVGRVWGRSDESSV